MSEMVERVAKAICLKDHGYNIWMDQAEMVRQQYIERAKAAIEAMREPTDEMLYAAMITVTRENKGIEYAPLGGWRAMIDAALKE